MNTPQKWVSDNYDKIIKWAYQAAHGSEIAVDVAHDMMIAFIEHPRAQELVNKGEARWFIVRMLLNQLRSTTSPAYKMYKLNQDKQQKVELQEDETIDEPYDTELDFTIEAIQGVCEDLKSESIEGYYCITIFELVIQQKKPNYSKLAEETLIPRTSISVAYNQAVEMIKNRLNQYGYLN